MKILLMTQTYKKTDYFSKDLYKSSNIYHIYLIIENSIYNYNNLNYFLRHQNSSHD